MKLTKDFKMLVFGTYRLRDEVLEIAANQAVHAMISNGISQPIVDTAVSYNNTNVIKRLIARYPNVLIGTKFKKPNELEQQLKAELQNYGSNLYRALLHKHMPIKSYLTLLKAKAVGEIHEVGISNYSAQQIHHLVSSLKALEKLSQLPIRLSEAIPDVCQNEFHPFLETTVPQVCKEYNIRFEAHSVHSLLDNYPDEIKDQSSPSVGQVAIAYALQRGSGSVVFNSANYEHVLQNLDVITLNEQTLSLLDHQKRRMVSARYPGSDTLRFDPTLTHINSPAGSGFEDLPKDYIRNVIAPKIKEDMTAPAEGKIPSNFANGIPRVDFRNEKSLRALQVLANAIFVKENGETIVFFEDVNKDTQAKMARLATVLRDIRRYRQEKIKETKHKAKPKTCKLRAIEDPKALPVEIPDPAVLQPFIDLVAAAKKLPETAIRMERGVLFPDGRLDFCKQVAQPSFQHLCEAVFASGVVKHFLIGNNLALADDWDGQREAALVNLIEKSKGISTFFLAGNAIDQNQIKSIAEAFARSDDAKYVWLKMNPIKTGSYHLGKMLQSNPQIEVLDLFNTGQCDNGVHALLRGLKEGTSGPNANGLKHLYLDINAITNGASVVEVVTELPHLESLSLNVNQLGDGGVIDVCDGLMALNSPHPLERLVLGSNGCTDEILPKLTELVRHSPKLTMLQLGSYKSTKFFKHQSNQFKSFDKVLGLGKALASNATPGIKFLGFQNAYCSEDVAELALAIAKLGVHCFGSQQQQKKGINTTTSKQLNQLLGTPISIQPPPVEYIQSVYRTTM